MLTTSVSTQLVCTNVELIDSCGASHLGLDSGHIAADAVLILHNHSRLVGVAVLIERNRTGGKFQIGGRDGITQRLTAEGLNGLQAVNNNLQGLISQSGVGARGIAIDLLKRLHPSFGRFTVALGAEAGDVTCAFHHVRAGSLCQSRHVPGIAAQEGGGNAHGSGLLNLQRQLANLVRHPQYVRLLIFPLQGQTVLGESFRKAPGGKGANQAVQAARLGAQVTMCGKLGYDSNGKELLSACEEAGIRTEHILYDPSEPSGCAVIILEEKPNQSAENRIVVIPGSNMRITQEDIAFLQEGITDYDMVMLQLEIPMAINETVAAYAHAKGIPVMLNSAPSAPLSDGFLSHLAYISPNEHEIEDLTGIHIRHQGTQVNWEDAEQAAGILRAKGVKNVLVTLGSAGAILVNDCGSYYSPCAEGITAVDPTAAGDSFVAAFCTGVCCGWSWEDILTFANHTAGITVSSMGAMPSLPRLEQVESFLLQRGNHLPDTSLLR